MQNWELQGYAVISKFSFESDAQESVDGIKRDFASKLSKSNPQALFFTPSEEVSVLWAVQIYKDKQSAETASQSLSSTSSPHITRLESGLGKILGGWLHRPRPPHTNPNSISLSSIPRGPNETILFGKCTCQPQRRPDLTTILMTNFPIIDKEEEGTLTILLIESEANENVMYVMERFMDDEAVQKHGRGSGIPVIMPVFQEAVILRDGGVCKEVLV